MDNGPVSRTFLVDFASTRGRVPRPTATRSQGQKENTPKGAALVKRL